MKKPPLGLVPKFIRQEQRLKEIKQAISRYMAEDYILSYQWIIEYNEICEYLENRKIEKENLKK